MDETLRRKLEEYLSWIQRLLVQLTQLREHATLLFVRNKPEAIRRFREPSGVSLATPESLAALERSSPDRLSIAEADVKQLFPPITHS